MPRYREVEDFRRLASLSEELTRRLRRQLRYPRRRTIGFPGGRGEVVAQFSGAAGADLLWWVNGKSDNGQAY